MMRPRPRVRLENAVDDFADERLGKRRDIGIGCEPSGGFRHRHIPLALTGAVYAKTIGIQ